MGWSYPKLYDTLEVVEALEESCFRSKHIVKDLSDFIFFVHDNLSEKTGYKHEII